MADWLYTLAIKDLNDRQADDFDMAAINVAPEAAKRVRALMEKVQADSRINALARNDGLYEKLDEAADLLDEITLPDSIALWQAGAALQTPQQTYNEALELLYEAGDEGHLVWVQ